MANELAEGMRRQGDLFDLHESTPVLKVTLERVDNRIQVLVPWSDYTNHQAGWFVDTTMQSLDDEPSGTIPKQMIFRDSKGHVLLVDCRPGGYSTNMFGPGVGIVHARFAVVGVETNIDYRNLHGLRTEVSGLRAWVGVSSYKQERQHDRARHNLTVKVESPDAIDVGSGLRLIPTWTSSRTPETFTLSQGLFVETRTDEPTLWTDAMSAHRSLRDLLVMAQWTREVCNLTAALRTDDPYVDHEGQSHERWRELVASGQEERPEPLPYQRGLVQFKDIGVEGLLAWISLREQFSRAFDPIVFTRYLTKVSPSTSLAQAGPGIEALGYLLMIEDGMLPKLAARTTLSSRLTRVLDDISDCVPFDGADWVSGTADAYNSLKHANRALPAEVEIMNRWRETTLAVRIWVARRLGVPAEVIQTRLDNDPQVHPYRPVG